MTPSSKYYVCIAFSFIEFCLDLSNRRKISPFVEVSRRKEEKEMNRKIESYCPDCGKPIYEDENALTGFCEECSKDK
jgi:hypothetical protein